MDFVKTQFQRIQQQLTGLTASQKMLTAALVAVMVMTLLYWGRYAGTAEMVPLLEQTLSPGEMGQIQSRLRARNIPFEPVGDRIMVPADRQPEIYADLAYSKSLPLVTEAGFELMVKKLNPWAPASERDAMFNRAKEITCAQIIGLFPGVEHVSVVIDPTNKRHMGSKVEPSANITIRTRSGADGKSQLAQSAAAVVKGSEAALRVERITVNVDGQMVRVRDASGADGGLAATAADQLELKLKAEEVERKKIEDLLRDVPNVLVSVSVKLDNESLDLTRQTIDPKNTITKITSEENQESSSGEAGTGEPGANPNIVANGPLDAADGAAGATGQRTQESTERIQSQVLTSFEKQHIQRGPGEGKVISATVRLPQSYFENAVRGRNGNAGAKPTLAEVEQYAGKKMKEMEESVRASAGMAPEATVRVALYDDVTTTIDPTVPQTATMSIPVALGRHGKEIALGGLALVSLFMVSMMVKRSAPAAILAAPAAVAPAMGPGPLMAGELFAGEAGSGDAVLAGMELDEDAVKTQQMLEQVSTMVKDNPDAAASLVKRWLNRD